MKIENYQFPKSSFLSIEKDLEIITGQMLKNDRFKKLLFYTVPDALDKPNLTKQESLSLFNKNIKIVPKIQIDEKVLNYIVISFDTFTPNENNPEFRDNIIVFEIFCHFDQWQLKDFQLRPYRIAAEIDTLFNKKHLTGIGKLSFLGASQIMFGNEFGGVSLMYQTIHGEEDKKGMLNPDDNKDYIEDFNEIFNQ